jgi:tetratricopeptide (TPR) repeat protein
MLFWYHPVWGIGPGQFDSRFFQYRPPAVQTRPMYAHNDYLNTLSEWGLVGMAIIAVAVGLVLYCGWKSWVAGPQLEPVTGKVIKSDKTAFLVGAGVGLLAIGVHCLVDFNMHIPANAAIAVVLMALISAQWRFVTERCWKNPGMLGKVLLTGVIAGGVAWLSVQELGRAREAYWESRSADETATYADRFAALEKAYAAQPDNYVNSYHLGEYYRLLSEQDEHDYARECLEAMRWYARSMAENPVDSFVPMRYGMCLDGMGRAEEATRYFNMAERMDPNSGKLAYYMAAHCVDRGHYLAAHKWIFYCLSMDRDDLELSLATLIDRTLRQMGYTIK